MDYDPNKRMRLSGTTSSSLPAYNPPPPPPPASASPSASSPLDIGGAPARRSLATARPVASISGQGSSKLRLTVKAQPSRLRHATSGATSLPPNPYTDASESDATPVPPTRTARSTRNPRTVVEPDSDDLEDEDDELDDAEVDVNDETMIGDDSEEDAEGDDDEDMDDMDEHPPPPMIQQGVLNGRPNVVVTAPSEGPLKSVEAKEMEDDDDEDEEDLSDMMSDGVGHEEDNDDEDADGDTDDEDGSRSATPDLSKLTRRQRVNVEEVPDDSLLALSNEAQKKKHLTVEEHAMRRSEMAKRRKNLSEQRNEEEKMDTINKLLSKPAPKRRTRAEIIAQERADGATPSAEDGEFERPDALFVRWVNNRSGSRIGVPAEWLDGPIGDVFKPQGPAVSRAGGLIQEVS